jgi:hypothetical protein
MRRLLRLAFPLGIVAIMLAAPSTSGAQVTVTPDSTANIALNAQRPTTNRQNTDMAFWANTLVQGDSRGIRVFDISDPTTPVLLSDFACHGAYGDVSIWGNLVFRSVDRPQDSAGCGSADTTTTVTPANLTSAAAATGQATSQAPGWEGVQIISIANPASPQFVAGVATDCGAHANTIVPDTANNRVLLYVSSMPNDGYGNSGFGTSCDLLAAGSPAPPNHVSGHDKISIIEVPLGNPASASVINEVTLGTKGFDPFFNWILDYTGDFSNMPGYKGCSDVAVYMPAKKAAAACVTEGLMLDISNPAAPTVTEHFVNPSIDRCSTGVFHLTVSSSTTAAGPNNCMWSTAAFSYDGKYVMFGDLSSGFNRCRGTGENTTPSTCGQTGLSINVGADRYYDGTSVTNECDIGTANANPRDTYDRGAYWLFDVDHPDWPVSSAKPETPRYIRQPNQGCSSRLGGFIPAVGTYQTTGAWGLMGMDVIDWDDFFNTTETAYYVVETGGADAVAAANAPERSHAWSAYWYNGHIYVSYDMPMYGSWVPTASRGLEVFTVNDPALNGAFDLQRLNPQTIESALKCSISSSGNAKVGKKTTINVTVKVLGQALAGHTVSLTSYQISQAKTTNASGKVSFTVKPKKTNSLKFAVADDVNMLGCNASKSVAKAKKKK